MFFDHYFVLLIVCGIVGYVIGLNIKTTILIYIVLASLYVAAL